MQFSNPRWHQCRLHHCSPLYSWHSHTTPRAAFNSRVFLETEKEAKVLAATRLHFPNSAQHPWDQQLLCPPTWAWRGENPSGGFLCCSLYSVNQCTRWSRAIEGMHQEYGTGDRRTLRAACPCPQGAGTSPAPPPASQIWEEQHETTCMPLSCMSPEAVTQIHCTVHCREE